MDLSIINKILFKFETKFLKKYIFFNLKYKMNNTFVTSIINF